MHLQTLEVESIMYLPLDSSRIEEYHCTVIKGMLYYTMCFGTLEFNDTIRANICNVSVFNFCTLRSCTTYSPIVKVSILPSNNNIAIIVVFL